MPRRPFQDDTHPPLYQVVVDENHPVHGRRELRVGPRMCKEFLGPIMEMIGRRIADGTEKASGQPWSNPRLVMCTDTLHPEQDSPFTREDRQNPLVGGHRAGPVATPSILMN
jgi:hypothetical protein